jgi:hypothetical protein
MGWKQRGLLRLVGSDTYNSVLKGAMHVDEYQESISIIFLKTAFGTT